MQHVFLALPSSAGLQVFFTFRTNREVAIVRDHDLEAIRGAFQA